MARLLVVEDDPAAARAVARALRAVGHTPAVVGSCADARAIREPYDCGILDIDLGDGNGIDLARELLERGLVGGVLFYSGSIELDVERRTAEIGPLVLKSQPMSRLLAELGRILTA
jgi:DNA-binding response OmpR family regulator